MKKSKFPLTLLPSFMTSNFCNAKWERRKEERNGSNQENGKEETTGTKFGKKNLRLNKMEKEQEFKRERMEKGREGKEMERKIKDGNERAKEIQGW